MHRLQAADDGPARVDVRSFILSPVSPRGFCKHGSRGVQGVQQGAQQDSSRHPEVPPHCVLCERTFGEDGQKISP
jgi:hypothetical protein